MTGTTPFDKDRLHAATYDELRRIIREEEPPRPSARISTLAADLATTVAEHRRTDARRLQQTVRGELDWIVMKCLEKDRNRRYETAGSLAATSSAICTTSRCRPARRRPLIGSANSLAATRRCWPPARSDCRSASRWPWAIHVAVLSRATTDGAKRHGGFRFPARRCFIPPIPIETKMRAT